MCCWIRKVSKNKKTSSPSPLPLPRREGSDYRDTPRILRTRNRWFKRKRGVNSKLSFYPLNIELWALNFMICILTLELWTVNTSVIIICSWRVDKFTSLQVACRNKSQLTVVIIIMTYWWKLCSNNYELWIMAVIIIMNFELWIMNYSSNHNYEFWIMNYKLENIYLYNSATKKCKV